MNSKEFEQHNKEMIEKLGSSTASKELTHDWFVQASKHEYSYHFKWLGRPIIQYPQDIIAIQEIIWETKPDLIIETGIARGGSLIFYASMLELIGGEGLVLGIDVDIREHNKSEIENHSMFKRVQMIEGSSIDESIFKKVNDIAKGKENILVILDSNHTHEHVTRELELYSPFVKKGSYLIVLDTIIEDMPNEFSSDRPWGKGNNPQTAVLEFLKTNNRFSIDHQTENKLLITVAPSGYLRCIKD